MVAEKFQIHGVKVTVKCICESKNWICSFLLMSETKNLPQVLIITTPGRRKLPISHKQLFLYFSPTERGRIMELKKWPNLNLRGYWSHFLIDSTVFGIFTFWFLFYCAIILIQACWSVKVLLVNFFNFH